MLIRHDFETLSLLFGYSVLQSPNTSFEAVNSGILSTANRMFRPGFDGGRGVDSPASLEAGSSGDRGAGGADGCPLD